MGEKKLTCRFDTFNSEFEKVYAKMVAFNLRIYLGICLQGLRRNTGELVVRIAGI
jgi:hypothetical protein